MVKDEANAGVITGVSNGTLDLVDFDNDGDLDCYLLNNTIKSIGVGLDMVKGLRDISSDQGNKLLRNDDGYFNNCLLYTSDAADE